MRCTGAWAAELERRWPGSLRLFAPSETQAARAQLGSRRFKTDDRDCAALVWLLRQGAGRPSAPSRVEALLGAVRHRRQLVDARRVAQQRLHDQLNVLCPGLSAPVGHGRVLELENPSGRAVLACAVAFAGRAPSTRSLIARAPGRLSDGNARFWAGRWKRLLPSPADAELRAHRLGRDVERWLGLREDITALEAQLAELLARTDGQILTSLPGVAVVRAAAFAAHTLPIERWPTPEHLYSATGLATGQLPVRLGHPPRADQPPRPRRTPRRADGHRLGPLPAQPRVRRARPRVPRPRVPPDPGARRLGPPRLPTRLAAHDLPTALRRSALRSSPAQARAVTAITAMPHDGAT